MPLPCCFLPDRSEDSESVEGVCVRRFTTRNLAFAFLQETDLEEHGCGAGGVAGSVSFTAAAVPFLSPVVFATTGLSSTFPLTGKVVSIGAFIPPESINRLTTHRILAFVFLQQAVKVVHVLSCYCEKLGVV